MFCWNCGLDIEDGSKFCMYCGTVLAQDDAPAAPEAPKAAAPGPIEDERDTIWGRGEPKAQPDYSRPQPRDDGGYDRPAAPRSGANIQLSMANLDKILAYAGIAVLVLCTFIPFAGVKGYDGSVSLMEKSSNHVGLILIVYAVLAAAGLYLKQKFVFYAMAICTTVFMIYEASAMKASLGGYSITYKVGFWFLVIASILMIAASVMMIMNEKNKKR
ncbi:MAG: zinc-ribbon domain-containing protein, partial [Lachnospiraceae bacterium]|nr:zinc-ribbon domain-containing protein [Lachnospiraceae bacterium]